MTRTLWFTFLITFFYTTTASGGMFDEAVNEPAGDSAAPGNSGYELNGYVRGSIFAGEAVDSDETTLKSTLAEAALKLRFRKNEDAEAFFDLRVATNPQDSEEQNHTVLHEAYVSLYKHNFDMRVGRQVIVWGKADSINPTNTITPIDYNVYSPSEDDRRKSNLLIRVHFHWDPLVMEGIWVPSHLSSPLPFTTDDLPAGMELQAEPDSNQKLNQGSTALKLHMELAAIDAAISIFDGCHPTPGIRTRTAASGETVIYPEPYRVRVYGADFSTTAGSFGLRGEFAYSDPVDDEDTIWQSVPKPQFEAVLGIDREFGNFSLILQAVGKLVMNFEEPAAPAATAEIVHWNRLMFAQTEERSDSISLRPAWKLFHETVQLELLGLSNLTTEELFVKPKVTISLADDLSLIAGAQWYAGTTGTLYGELAKKRSAVFTEIKASF